MRQSIHFSGVMGLMLAMFVWPCRAAEEATADKIISRSFTVQPGWSVSVEADQGDIEVLTGKQNVVEVVVTREVTEVSESQATKILKKHQVKAALEGETVFVETKTSKGSRDGSQTKQPELSVHIKLTVPKRFDVRLQTLGGIIEATGLQGAVEAKTSGGDMCFTNIHGALNGQSSGGNIRVSGCADKLQVHTSGGNIVISDFTGPTLQADSTGGNIAIKGCTGALAIKTAGGNISVEDFTGTQAYADTGGGSVTLELGSALLSDSWFRTAGGNITVKMAENAGVNLNATTDGGTITTAIPVESTVKGRVQEGKLEGKMNGGGPKLLLKTSGGNIEILKK